MEIVRQTVSVVLFFDIIIITPGAPTFQPLEVGNKGLSVRKLLLSPDHIFAKLVT
jgi:hypothetical protein